MITSPARASYRQREQLHRLGYRGPISELSPSDAAAEIRRLARERAFDAAADNGYYSRLAGMRLYFPRSYAYFCLSGLTGYHTPGVYDEGDV